MFRFLARALLPHDLGWPLTNTEWELLLAYAASFMKRQWQLSPFFTKYPLMVLTLIFILWLQLACCLAVPKQAALRWWERLGGLPARSTVRAWRSLLMLAICEHPLALGQMQQATVHQRHQYFRYLRAGLLLTH